MFYVKVWKMEVLFLLWTDIDGNIDVMIKLSVLFG